MADRAQWPAGPVPNSSTLILNKYRRTLANVKHGSNKNKWPSQVCGWWCMFVQILLNQCPISVIAVQYTFVSLAHTSPALFNCVFYSVCSFYEMFMALKEGFMGLGICHYAQVDNSYGTTCCLGDRTAYFDSAFCVLYETELLTVF